MSILINKDTKVLVQGITGKEGSFHTKLMLQYGTKVVAGVTPGKFGQKIEGVPVYDTVKEAMENHHIDATAIFVPGRFAMGAALEAIDAGIRLVVVITEGVPLHDSLRIKSKAKRMGTTVIGPNTPGIVTPGECKVGLVNTDYLSKGNVGLISRSGSLMTEIAANLTDTGIGQSTLVGIGGDAVLGSTILDVLKMFEKDKETKGVVIVGEIGGTMEEEASEYIKTMNKPVVAWIAGRNVPKGKRMGHAGAIIEGTMGTAESKVSALKKAGAKVADVPWDIGKLMKEML